MDDSGSDLASQQRPPREVVIAGAGIMGLATAYYLAVQHATAEQRMKITVVDPTGRVAPAASGKAGGFLALDWNDSAPAGPLARRSFQLHQDLADALGAESIQYRRLTCVAVTVREGNDDDEGRGGTRRPSGKKLAGIEWAQRADDDGQGAAGSESIQAGSDRIAGVQNLGDERTIAQVHPRLLCERLWEETRMAPAAEASIVRGRVAAPVFGDGGRVSGARVVACSASGDDEPGEALVLTADALVLACGPWATNRMLGIKYHSAVVPTSKVLTQCVFFSGYGDPEVYVRPDSTAYCTGFPEDPRVVTERPGQERVDPESVARILDSVRSATGGSSDGGTGSALSQDPAVQQSCYLPTTRDGIPVVGRVPARVAGGSGVYLCAGHTCWGILMGPASGEAVASLVATGRCDKVDLRPFDPERLGQFELFRGR
jgi:glycine/D-amino acid oxidase-like deaminating enzyme